MFTKIEEGTVELVFDGVDRQAELFGYFVAGTFGLLFVSGPQLIAPYFYAVIQAGKNYFFLDFGKFFQVSGNNYAA